jgi:hypothetical protein
MIHIMMAQYLHFSWSQEFVFFVVMIKEERLTVRTSISDGIQPNISSNMSCVEVANQLLSHLHWHLRACKSSNILNSARARLRKSIHLEETAVGLVHEEHEKE